VNGGAGVIGSLKRVRQRWSHAHLSKDVSRLPAPPIMSRRGRVDAIIVPASRPAGCLQLAIDLSTFLGVPLVALCSKKTRPRRVTNRVLRTPGAQSLVVEVPVDWSHEGIPNRTSDPVFKNASANRTSDLSAKRNLGLLLARLLGWNKIVFLDDDVSDIAKCDIARIAGQLGKHQVAGMRLEEYPDNSVVCHARRLAKLPQDVFVTGAVLGVHCNSLPLSFFPDIYNEDWFFFAKEAAEYRLPRVGDAIQAKYDPFANPRRARLEEFGDLLAEGLYALIGDDKSGSSFEDQLRRATAAYWSRFIDARHAVIARAKSQLSCSLDRHPENASAVRSLRAAKRQLETITPDLCVNFLEAWRDDLASWQRFSNGVNNVGSTSEAMDLLGLETWTLVQSRSQAIDSKVPRCIGRPDQSWRAEIGSIRTAIGG
jgi:hypothetical protein